MNAWLLEDYSGLDGLRLETDAPDPSPGRGEVVLDLQFAALNPADRYLAMRQYPAQPPLPHVLGRDGIGVVSAVGPGVSGVRPGETKIIVRGATGVERWGTFAEKVAVKADELEDPPADWTAEQAASASLVYLAAWQALTQFGPLSQDDVILITGASGGVGVASVQLAHAMGCRVVALSRSEEKQAQLRELGATLTLDPGLDDLSKQVKSQVGPVKLAVENVCGEGLTKVVASMGMHGRISVVGQLAGPVPNFKPSTLLFRRIWMGGVAVGTFDAPAAHAAWREVLSTLGRTGAKPLVDSVHAFDQLPQAFERLEEGPMGKVLVRVGVG